MYKYVTLVMEISKIEILFHIEYDEDSGQMFKENVSVRLGFLCFNSLNICKNLLEINKNKNTFLTI